MPAQNQSFLVGQTQYLAIFSRGISRTQSGRSNLGRQHHFCCAISRDLLKSGLTANNFRLVKIGRAHV